jgi:hypothetical protein
VTQSANALPTPDWIDERYRVEKRVGEGGLALVYQVHDSLSGETRALKRLSAQADPSLRQRYVELFEREFHTLEQLAHPRIVAVHDYGIAGTDPYYTMELLDGGDLYERAPVEWRQACSLARDVCSALSLLHSRRMVYRDLSPRNVRCTNDGQAKLIDFGAVAPIGLCKHIVGTASCCAPEVFNSQLLDARTDLYALGATLYYTLTRRMPYPVRDFKQLRDAWLQSPAPPSQWVAGIPAALDDLVMALLQLDPAGRPANAAEVMERLTGIAELPIDEHLLVSQAYLASPMLVGRETQLETVRSRLQRTARARGSSLLICGAAGQGRSRMLDACAIEAQLAGVTVLRADAEDAQDGDYGVVRALARQLLDKLPELALACATPLIATLGHVLPALLESADGVKLAEPADPAQLRPQLQAALQQWLFEVARQRPLLLAIDDMDRSDEPSAACLALLSNALADHALVLTLTSLPPSVDWAVPLALLAKASVPLELAELSASETLTLLASIFGEAPLLELVAERLHGISAGNPRDVMRLAQHLVDGRVVQYQAGAWSLPERIDSGDLPSSIAQALLASVDALSVEARSLAQALALCPEQHFSHEECNILCAQHLSPGQLLALIDELARAGVVKRSAERLGIAQHGWVTALRTRLAAAHERSVQLRLAQIFELRRDELRLSQHLLRAGEEQRAVDVLVAHARASQLTTDGDSEAFAALIAALPPDWIECYDSVLRLCERGLRPRRDLFELRSRLAGIVAVTGMENMGLLAGLLSQLEKDSGLDIYASLAAELDPGTRLRETFELAQRRYETTGEHDRVLDPLTAIRQLARSMIQLSGVTVTMRNLAFLATFPSLEPYLALSPALGVVQQLVAGVQFRATGRSELARRIYIALIERTDQPDRAGLDDAHHFHATMGVKFGIGILEAMFGLGSSLKRASEVETNPLYQVNAWTIRRLYHLWQGQLRDAERCKRAGDMLRLQNRRRQFFENGHLAIELAAHVAAGELIEVKRTLPSLELLARRYEGWQPIWRYAVGEYHRLRGDNRQALSELDAALSGGPMCHELWANAAGAAILALVELGRADEAIERGVTLLASAQQAQIGCMSHVIRLPLAQAHAAAGAYADAALQAQTAVDELQALGATGLRIANAYRAQARIAAATGDQASAAKYAARGVAAFLPGADPRLLARHRWVHDRVDLVPRHLTTSGPVTTRSLVDAVSSGDVRERRQRGLGLLVESSEASGGHLFVIEAEEPRLVASIGRRPLPHAIMELSMARLAELATEDSDIKTSMSDAGSAFGTTDPASASWLGPEGEIYRPIPLHHYAEDGAFKLVGLAVLVVEPGGAFVYPAGMASELSRVVVHTDVT